MQHAALAAEAERQLRTGNTDVPVAHGGEAERIVFLGILLVADPNERGLEKADYRRKHLFARQATAPQVVLDAAPDHGQHSSEGDHSGKFVLIADGAVRGMVAILLAAAGSATGGLKMPVGRRADPDLGPRGRNGEGTDAGKLSLAAQRLAIRTDVTEGLAAPDALDAGSRPVDVAESRLRCRFTGIGRKHTDVTLSNRGARSAGGARPPQPPMECMGRGGGTNLPELIS
jgi:hypothetical protein